MFLGFIHPFCVFCICTIQDCENTGYRDWCTVQSVWSKLDGLRSIWNLYLLELISTVSLLITCYIQAWNTWAGSPLQMWSGICSAKAYKPTRLFIPEQREQALYGLWISCKKREIGHHELGLHYFAWYFRQHLVEIL